MRLPIVLRAPQVNAQSQEESGQDPVVDFGRIGNPKGCAAHSKPVRNAANVLPNALTKQEVEGNRRDAQPALRQADGSIAGEKLQTVTALPSRVAKDSRERHRLCVPLDRQRSEAAVPLVLI